jgi:hypothetical protein
MHFKQDVVNGLVRVNLPSSHPLFQLLSPHLENALAINAMVLQGSGSVIYGEKDHLPYNPLPVKGEDFLNLLTKHQKGTPFYTFKLDESGEAAFDPHFMYGRYLRAYYSVVFSFVSQVFEKIERGAEMDRLIEDLAFFIPEFGTNTKTEQENGEGEMDGADQKIDNWGRLKLLCINFIFASSVWHR